MNDRTVRLLWLAIFILVGSIPAPAQAVQEAGTLVIAGQSEHAPLVQINGKTYVAVESLARITHGSIRFQGSQTILTLPVGSGATEAQTQSDKPAQLSSGFLRAEVEALTSIREWRAAMVNAVENNVAVSENLVGGLRRSADRSLQLAIAATSTDSDRKAAELLHNEFANMQQMSDQLLAMHAKASYVATDSFVGNPLDQKILNCSRGLASMTASKQFQDEPACH